MMIYWAVEVTWLIIIRWVVCYNGFKSLYSLWMISASATKHPEIMTHSTVLYILYELKRLIAHDSIEIAFILYIVLKLQYNSILIYYIEFWKHVQRSINQITIIWLNSISKSYNIEFCKMSFILNQSSKRDPF